MGGTPLRHGAQPGSIAKHLGQWHLCAHELSICTLVNANQGAATAGNIAANLANDLGTTRVWSYAQSMQTKVDYQVSIDVQSFDARLGEVVVIDVLWTIRPSASNASGVTPAKAWKLPDFRG